MAAAANKPDIMQYNQSQHLKDPRKAGTGHYFIRCPCTSILAGLSTYANSKHGLYFPLYPHDVNLCKEVHYMVHFPPHIFLMTYL